MITLITRTYQRLLSDRVRQLRSDALEELRWKLYVRGGKLVSVTVEQPSELHKNYKVIGHGVPLPPSIGYDDLGNPCEEYPK